MSDSLEQSPVHCTLQWPRALVPIVKIYRYVYYIGGYIERESSSGKSDAVVALGNVIVSI